MFTVSVLTAGKRVGGLWKFREVVLSVANGVGGLQRFGVLVLTTAKV